MGYAKYVGRVGGLAVALGVGVAVATTPGVAWADPTDSGSTSSSSDTNADTTSSGTTEPAESPAGASDADDAGSTVDTDDGAAGEDQPKGSEGTEKSTGSTVKDKKSGSDFSASTRKAPKRSVVSTPSTSDVSKRESVADSTVAVQPKPEPVAPPTVRGVSVVEVASVTTAKASLGEPVVEPEPEPVETPLESKLLSAVGLAPSADGDVPQVPGESPLTLVALAALRRQTQQSLVEDEAATPAYQLDSSIPIGSGPTGLAVTPDGGHVYVADRFTKSVHVVDTSTGAVETIYLGAGPNHVAFKPDGSRAYVGLHGINQVAVIDTATKKVIASVKVGPGATETVVTPDGKFAYVTNTSGRTVSVIDTGTNTEIARVTVGSSPMGLAVTPDGSKVYVANRYSSSVSVIDVATNKVISTVTVGSSPRSVAITPVLPDTPPGSPVYAYVTSAGPNTVSVIDTATDRVVQKITVGPDPIGVAMSPDGAFVYAANSNDTVSVIDTASHTVVGKFAVDPRPETGVHYIAVSELDGTVYVTDTRDKMLRVVTVTPAADMSTLSLREDAEPTMLMAASLAANSAPTVPVQPTGIPHPATGVVSGNVVASDSDGNPLTYSVTGTSANGGTVTINSTTGAYTYTPTAAARLAAGTTTGADTDTFTVSVFDGQTTTTGTVPVYVSPTQLGSGPTASVGDQPVSVAVYEDPDDPTRNRTYVINQYSKTVSVIETDPNSFNYGSVKATIKLPSSPSDIVINHAGTRAYVTMKGNASVAVIDTATNKQIDVNTSTSTVDSIRVGSTPAGIAVSPNDSRLYVANGGSNTVSVIDTALNKEISRITVGSQPSGIAVSPDGKKLYVTLRYSDSLAVVNLADNTKTLFKVGDSPREVVLNGTTAYVSNYDGTVSVVNTTAPPNTLSPKIITGGPKYQPAGVAIDSTSGLVYVANGNDSLTVIDSKTNTLVRTIRYESGYSGAHAIAVGADGRIYVTDHRDDKLRVMSLMRGNTAPLSVGNPTVDNPNSTTGAVSGLVNIKDPDGDALSYTAVVSPTSGSVSFNPTTGTYTYTPTAAARQQAGQGGPTTDTFTVRVSDSYDTFKDASVTVPISAVSSVPVTVSAINVTSPTAVGFGGNQLYVYGEGTGIVSVINPATKQVTSVGSPWSEPPAISPAGDRKYVVNGSNISVIDTATGTVIEDIAIPQYGIDLHDLVVNPDGTRVYVSEYVSYWEFPSATVVHVIDATNNTYLYTVSAPGYGLSDLDATPGGTRLYGGDYNLAYVYVFDRDMNHVASVPLTSNPHGSLGWVDSLGISADGTKAYALYHADVNNVGDYSHKVAVIDSDPTSATYNTVLAQVGVQTTAVSPDGGQRYTLQSDGKTVIVSDTATNTVIGAFATDQNPSAGARSIVVSPNGILYITDAADSKVYVVTVGGTTVV